MRCPGCGTPENPPPCLLLPRLHPCSTVHACPPIDCAQVPEFSGLSILPPAPVPSLRQCPRASSIAERSQRETEGRRSQRRQRLGSPIHVSGAGRLVLPAMAYRRDPTIARFQSQPTCLPVVWPAEAARSRGHADPSRNCEFLPCGEARTTFLFWGTWVFRSGH